MSYDLNILVIGQTGSPSYLPFGSSIELKNEIDHSYFVGRYNDMWHFMRQTQGIWYGLGQDIIQEGFWSAMPFMEAQFKVEDIKVLCPYWVSSRENLVPLKFVPGAQNEMARILDFLMEASPTKTIMVMARFQCVPEEVVCGVLLSKEFWTLHDCGQILFNTCYIVSKFPL